MDAPESISGRKEVENGEEGIEIEYSGQYDYMMIQLESEDSLGRDVLYEVVCINLKTGGGSSDSGSSSGGNADGSTKYGYGFELKEVDTDQRIVTVVSEQTGTLKATLATADFGFSTTAATQTIIANEEISFTYPAVGGPFELELFLQFTDASGNVYQRYGGISINN